MNNKTQKAISARASALLYAETEAKGVEPHADDYDNVAAKVASEFGVSENEVRYLAEFPLN